MRISARAYTKESSINEESSLNRRIVVIRFFTLGALCAWGRGGLGRHDRRIVRYTLPPILFRTLPRCPRGSDARRSFYADAVPTEPLTLLAVGQASSPHVQSRTDCFRQRGHRVKILTTEASSRAGVEEIVPRPPFDIPKARSLGLTLDTLRAISRTEADLVHVHFAHGLGAWLAPAATARPLVVSVMGGDILFDERRRTPAERRLTKRLLQNADLITAKASHLADVARHLAPGVRCETVIWGVDTRQFRPLDGSPMRQRLGFAPDDLLILSPKALQPLYNAHLLVEALSKVVTSVPQARLVLIDHVVDSGYRAELVARIENLHLQSHVRFLPPAPHAQMAEHYAVADVIASVPSSDGMPQSLLEALACGRVNLLPASSRYEELITDGESAIMVALNVFDMAETLTRLLTSPELRQRVAENGRRLILQRADFDHEVSRVEGFYRELLVGPRRRSLRKRSGLLMGTLKDLFVVRR